MRFVLNPEGVIVPDLGEKLPGRGAWVSAERSAVERAVAKGLFSRAFKATVAAPAGLAAQVEAGLERRMLAALGLAKRAGDAVIGFDQVRAGLKEGPPGALVFAHEAARDGREKLLRLAYAAHGEDVFLAAFASEAALGLAFGREGAIYAALRPGGVARMFKREAHRLAGFRDLVPPDWRMEARRGGDEGSPAAEGAAPDAGGDGAKR